MDVQLPPNNAEYLLRPAAPSSGGFQNFIRKLQKQYSQASNTLELSEEDIAKIRQYAQRGDGGWQNFFRELEGLIDQ